jgi:V8-like Glu-specific endopeptidase/lysophospholipase L1-like esterase
MAIPSSDSSIKNLISKVIGDLKLDDSDSSVYEFLSRTIQAEERYDQNKNTRIQREKSLKGGDWIGLDQTDRVLARLKRLGLKNTISETMRETTADGISGINVFERIIEQNNLMGIKFLRKGACVSRSVGRIVISSKYDFLGYGTGFMISPRLLMTNNHVLRKFVHAENSKVQFNFVELSLGKNSTPTEYWFKPEDFFLTDAKLDFTLVAVEEKNRDGLSVRDQGWNSLIRESGKAIVGEKVNIIQHPGGNPMQLALRENKIIDVLDDFLHYEADTLQGSSGSPVFNDQWEIAALHHAGVPRKKRIGSKLRYMLKTGVPWDGKRNTEHLIDWVANEGTRISKIVKFVENENLDIQKRRLFEETFENDPCDKILSGAREKLETPLENRESLSTMENPPIYLPRGRLNREPDGKFSISFTLGSDFSTDLANFNAIKEDDRTGDKTETGDNKMAKMITADELRDMLEDPNITDKELRPYFIEDEVQSGAFAPTLRMNFENVEHDGLEGSVFMGFFNKRAKRRRQRKYRRKIKGGFNGIKIVSEGDSWFQYPLLLDDVIDNLFDEYAIFSLGEAGDLISQMIDEDEVEEAVDREKPQVFLISGGGNDMVGDRRLAKYVHPFENGRDPKDYPLPGFQGFLQTIGNHYRNLFDQLINKDKNLKIITHGYDHVIPNNGKWLGRPLNSIGIRDKSLQREIMRVLIDALNIELETISHERKNNVFHVDCRKVVPDDQWKDELHPTDKGFKAVAEEFREKINSVV